MHKINKVELRSLQLEDYTQLSQSFQEGIRRQGCFLDPQADRDVDTDISRGQVVTLVDDRIVGCALSIIVDYDMVKGIIPTPSNGQRDVQHA